MKLVKTYSAAVFGINAFLITIEVSVSQGIRYFLVGLPDAAVKESQQRIESSLQVIGYRLPGKKIIINMSPADVRKEGASFDLPIALGILMASEQIDIKSNRQCMYVGELSLDGKILPIKGALQITLEAKSQGFEYIVLPKQNAIEASIVEGIKVIGAESLKDVIGYIKANFENASITKVNTSNIFRHSLKNIPDLSDIKGQAKMKRALEIAAAGGHNLLMIGSPGSGKTMISKRLPGILPPLTLDEAIETTKIHSILGQTSPANPIITERPFRAPHHSSSDAALIGGGSYPMPGEISMAHNGVLFLDELPEFKRHVIEVLRQPLEERQITISRARWSMNYPANCLLITAMNPCPCGYLNHPTKKCVCSPRAIQNYLHKISGPILDRIDLHLEVVPVEKEALLNAHAMETSSKEVLERVMGARAIQKHRFSELSSRKTNAQMDRKHIEKYCNLDIDSQNLLGKAMDSLQLSARAFDKIIKISRTIADLDQKENIKQQHIAEAIQYRTLDRNTIQ